jgi:GNAT superfamily N-acetyltransferase
MEPYLRLAADSDVDVLLPMMREYYAFDGHAFDEVRVRAALHTFLRERAYGRAWLICDGQEPVGYVVLTFGYSLEFLGRDAFIDEFYLRPSHRGRGWGRRTLEFVEQEARGFEIRSIHLEVVRENSNAQEIYRRSGYVDREHYLMTKWIERSFNKPVSSAH